MKSELRINPWITVTATDYERHMDSPNVGQLKFLNNLFRDVLKEIKPVSLAVPGCTTGNGFEHIDFNITEKVLAIDINHEYIKILRDRFKNQLDKIETICSDLDKFNFGEDIYDLFHCALIFEYVNIPSLLNQIYKSLHKNGIMSVLLQLPHENKPAVSETDFKTIKNLNGFINLVLPENFNEVAVSAGFKGDSENIFTLESGKAFWFGIFKKT